MFHHSSAPELEVATVVDMEVEVDTVGEEVADTAASTGWGPEVVGTVAATEVEDMMELEVDTVGDMEVEVDTAVGDMEVADTAASTWGGPEVVGTVAATEGAVVPTEGVAATWEETFSNGPKSRCILPFPFPFLRTQTT